MLTFFPPEFVAPLFFNKILYYIYACYYYYYYYYYYYFCFDNLRGEIVKLWLQLISRRRCVKICINIQNIKIFKQA